MRAEGEGGQAEETGGVGALLAVRNGTGRTVAAIQVVAHYFIT